MSNCLTRDTVAPRALDAALPGRVRTLPIDPGSACTRADADSGIVALALLGNETVVTVAERPLKRVQVQGVRRTANEAGLCPPQ